MSVSEIVETIVKVSGKDLEIVYDTTKPSRENNLKLDINRAVERYDWNPYVRLEDIVNELIT